MKKIFSLIIVLTMALSFTACSKSPSTSGTSSKTITIGASPVPHKEILEKVKSILKKEGYTLKIVEFNDYVTPNTALAEGELDANFFQHIPYLTKMNEEKKLNLDYTVKVHIEPMGLYSSKVKDIKSIKEGATIAIPNDATNGSRALKVLEVTGLIKLKAGEIVSKLDIIENLKKIKIMELDAPQLPKVLGEVDAALITANYALEASLNPTKDAIVLESKDSPYANILAVRKNNKSSEGIVALSKALNSDEIRNFIKENYKGNIIPAF